MPLPRRLTARTATVLAAVLLLTGAGTAAEATTPAAEHAAVAGTDKSGDVHIAGTGVPAWVSATRRAREVDITRLGVTADTDTLTATFTLADLQQTRTETTGRAAYRGTYLRRWVTTLYSTAGSPEDYFSLGFGYEESQQGRTNAADKPRVFATLAGTYTVCKHGTVQFAPATKQVTVTVPIGCFGSGYIRGRQYAVSGLAASLGLTTGDVYRDYGTDTTKTFGTLTLPRP